MGQACGCGNPEVSNPMVIVREATVQTTFTDDNTTTGELLKVQEEKLASLQFTLQKKKDDLRKKKVEEGKWCEKLRSMDQEYGEKILELALQQERYVTEVMGKDAELKLLRASQKKFEKELQEKEARLKELIDVEGKEIEFRKREKELLQEKADLEERERCEKRMLELQARQQEIEARERGERGKREKETAAAAEKTPIRPMTPPNFEPSTVSKEVVQSTKTAEMKTKNEPKKATTTQEGLLALFYLLLIVSIAGVILWYLLYYVLFGLSGLFSFLYGAPTAVSAPPAAAFSVPPNEKLPPHSASIKAAVPILENPAIVSTVMMDSLSVDVTTDLTASSSDSSWNVLDLKKITTSSSTWLNNTNLTSILSSAGQYVISSSPYSMCCGDSATSTFVLGIPFFILLCAGAVKLSEGLKYSAIAQSTGVTYEQAVSSAKMSKVMGFDKMFSGLGLGNVNDRPVPLQLNLGRKIGVLTLTASPNAYDKLGGILIIVLFVQLILQGTVCSYPFFFWKLSAGDMSSIAAPVWLVLEILRLVFNTLIVFPLHLLGGAEMYALVEKIG